MATPTVERHSAERAEVVHSAERAEVLISADSHVAEPDEFHQMVNASGDDVMRFFDVAGPFQPG